jgi:cytochrome bd ubiquinol oxidase subunit II
MRTGPATRTIKTGEAEIMGIDLPVIWMLIIGFGIMMYVIMDGFDLGIGILFPFIRDRAERDVMVNTVAPVWDGNETYLVLGGATLLGCFPLAYSVLLSALYFPLLLMLAGLIWRGVAFEFRFKADEAHRPFWDKAFSWGSYIATLCQGAALGAVINGFVVTGPSYAGGAFDWLTPFSLFTAVGLVVAYALLGATWLIMKTEGALHERMRALARPITWVLLAVIGIVSIWTPLTHAEVATRWFTLPNTFFFAPVPLLVLLTTWLLLRALRRGAHVAPFLLTVVLLFLGYSGLGISLWPNIIPPSISFRAAAAPPESMGFTLVGALVIIPIILVYSTWSYYVFRGKVRVGERYH